MKYSKKYDLEFQRLSVSKKNVLKYKGVNSTNSKFYNYEVYYSKTRSCITVEKYSNWLAKLIYIVLFPVLLIKYGWFEVKDEYVGVFSERKLGKFSTEHHWMCRESTFTKYISNLMTESK